MAGADRAIGALRGEPRVGLVDRDEGVQRGIAAADPLEQRLDGVHGRQRARAEGAGQLGDGGPHGIDRWSCAVSSVRFPQRMSITAVGQTANGRDCITAAGTAPRLPGAV